MPRLNKGDEKVVEQYGFLFATPPEKNSTRRSRYDEMWEAARELCKKFPNQTLKVRVHNNASAAYEDATKVNNGEKRNFAADYEEWVAVAAPSADENDVYGDDHPKAGQPMTAVYLTYVGPKSDAE